MQPEPMVKKKELPQCGIFFWNLPLTSCAATSLNENLQ
jgi:hypothetical protein